MPEVGGAPYVQDAELVYDDDRVGFGDTAPTSPVPAVTRARKRKDVLKNISSQIQLTAAGSIFIGATPAALGPIAITVAPPATANYGLVSLGDGPWDGISTGHFVGSALGTGVAINATSGFGGNLVDIQVAGISAFKL